MGLITLTIALPLLGAAALAFVDDDRQVRWVAIGASTLTFVAALGLLVRFEIGEAGFQLVERVTWIPTINATYHLAVDGISLVLILLTALLTPLVFLASDNVTDRLKGYFAAFLVLEAATIGVFSALDLLLFYVFFEFSLVPMYMIIGIWGGERRRYAAVKFFLYTLLGGLLMLAGILFLSSQAGGFGYQQVLELTLEPGTQRWLFVAFFLAFAIKVPIFPVHTWLPDAHTEAPTGGSVILAAVLLKMGGYGLIRFALPLFPDATQEFALGTGEGLLAVPWLLILAVVGILYGAVVALMQRDVKRLIAYSSVSHMGFVVLGLVALNLTAASAGVVQMINHGLSTGALFLLVGFLYERRHTRQIAAFGGLAKRTPVFAGLFLVVALSSLALPGLNGFVGEFPILLGTFQVAKWAGVLGAFGAVLAALYLLWTYQRVFHGPLEGADNENTSDLRPLEVAVMAPLVALIVAIGVYPAPLYDVVEPSVDRMLQLVDGDVAAAETGAVAPAVPRPATDPTATTDPATGR